MAKGKAVIQKTQGRYRKRPFFIKAGWLRHVAYRVVVEPSWHFKETVVRHGARVIVELRDESDSFYYDVSSHSPTDEHKAVKELTALINALQSARQALTHVQYKDAKRTGDEP